MTNEQEIVWSVFGVYLNDLKAYSTKPDRPTFKRLEEVRDRAVKALEQTRWIPVSERLPENDGMYLISTCMNCIDTCLFYKDDDEYLWVDYEDSVIAWMPLPQPYKECDAYAQ